ncbi:MAG: L-lactate permease [Gloeocapsa sp. DLM2.Bin57]|nr:MAG: L-lactate permease [Gloeocapsa sp. DLM2.Bin57]
MPIAIYSLLAFAPILTAFLLLAVANRPANQGMPIAYLVTVILCILVWEVPLNQIAAATFQGLIVALEIVYIVFGAILLLNVLQESGAISKIRQSLLGVSSDRRVQVILIAWLLGCFIEGASGFGSTAVVCVPLLVAIGFPGMAAVLAALLVQPTAASFGAVGTPFIIGVNNGLEGINAVTTEVERLGLSFSEYIDLIGAQTGIVQGLIGTFIPLALVLILTTTFGENKSWRDGLPVAGFAIFAGLALAIPYVLTAILLGPAFPSLFGSLIAMIIVIPAAKQGFLLPKQTWDFPDRSQWSPAWIGSKNSEITPGKAQMTGLLPWIPYVMLGVFLYLSRSRFLPLRDWLQAVQISFSDILLYRIKDYAVGFLSFTFRDD